MCGRFTLASKVSDLRELIDFIDEALPDELPPRYNIAPTQQVLAFRAEKDHHKPLPALLQWGLVPFWADDVKIGSRMINARSETVVEKPAFRAALKYRRCLIPVDGFYEWHKATESKTKTPYWIHRPDRKPFAFAGLWESWNKDGSGPLETCTILTTQANAMMGLLHDRMPVIVESRDFDRWLHTDAKQAAQLTDLFKPAPDDFLEAWPVSTAVNSPAIDNLDLIKPVET
jgi:putative SOS response-associated peptidase YedK